MDRITDEIAWNLIFVAWLAVLIGIAGSLYFSEVLDYPPCSLCWYQRIFLYPLFLIFIVGMVRKDLQHVYYTMPLALCGLIIAIYHNLLVYGFISDDLAPCRQGISCSERQIDWMGFVSIPLMSLLGFFLIFSTNVVVVMCVKKKILN